MPKRYADSIVFELRQKDQLVVLSNAQADELKTTYERISNLKATIHELETVQNIDAATITLLEKKTKKNKKLLHASMGSNIVLITLLLLL